MGGTASYFFRAYYGYTDQEGNSGQYGINYFWTTGGAVGAPPTATISPANGATGVPLNAQIVATVSSTIDFTSWSQKSIQLFDASNNLVAGTVTLASNRLSLTFIPAAALAPGMSYTISVSGFADQNGNVVTPATSTFTTGSMTASGFSLISTNITNGATGVSNTQPIILVFSQELNPATVNSSTLGLLINGNGSLGLAASYAVSGNTVTITPTSPYPAGATIYVGSCNGPVDVLGDVYSGCWNWLLSFTASSATSDNSALQVLSVNPANGATNVRHDQSVSVTFNKSINPYSVWNNSTNAQLYAGQDAVNNGSFNLSSDYRTLTFNNGALSDGTTYTISLPAGGIADESGNALASNFISTFTTAVNPASGAGSVTTARPGSNATSVPTDTVLTLFMNRAVDASTLPGNLNLTVNGQLVTGTVQAVSAYQVQFTPSTPFPNGATVQWFFSGVSDTAGNLFNSNSGAFYTVTAVNPATASPTVVAISPPLWVSDMPTNGEVDIAFNLPIDGSTLNGNTFINGVAATASLIAPNIVRLTPASLLSASSGPYYVCANNGSIMGTNGVAAQSDCYWAGAFYTTAGPDTTPGSVKIGPPNGVIGVGTNAYIRLQFSKAVDPTSINSTNVQITANGQAIDGAWSYNYSGNDIIGANFTPVNPLPASTAITVNTNGLLDYAGNIFTPNSAQFTTGALPDFTAANVSLDFGWYATGIATNASFTCRYSKAMDPSSITASGTYVYSFVSNATIPVTYTFSGDLTSVTMTPTAPLFANAQYYYSCQSAIDLTGNGQNNSYVYFYTGSGASSAGPVLLYANPPNGFSNVALNSEGGQWYGSSLGLLFNEPVAENSLGRITLTATPLGGGASSTIPISVNAVIGDTAAIVQLPYTLQPNTVYTYNISGVTDYNGNAIPPTTSSFTTGSSFDWTRPGVAASFPADQSTNVDVNTPLSVTFSKAMDPVLMSSNQVFLVVSNTGARVPTIMSFSADFTTVFLTPSAPLTPNTIYTLYMQINSWWLYDIAGNQLNTGQATATFTTGTPTAVDGACGTANGGSFSIAPTANLCAAGTASAVTNNGSWTWSCNGQYGSTNNAACSASVALSSTPAPQPFGLVGWWPGNDNANDLIGGNNGTLENGAGFALGEVEDAFSLNGNNQYVLIGEPVPANLQIQNAITLSAWIFPTAYPTDYGNGAYSMIVGSQEDYVAAGAALFLNGVVNSAGPSGEPVGGIILNLGDGSAFHGVETQTQVPLNQWTLVTATATANNTPLVYFNGVLQPTAAYGGTWNGTVSYPSNDWFAIGQEVNMNRPFNGLIDEVQVYNTALAAAQVQAIYNAGAAGMVAVQTASSTTVSSSASPAQVGDAVTFTASVSPTSATGAVTFRDGGIVLGTATLSGGQATLSTAALTFGPHSITAVYSGDTSYSSSNSTSLTQQMTINGASIAAPQNLIAWWNFDESSGTVAHDIAGGVNGSLQGGAAFTSGGVEGGAVSISGAGSLVDMGDNFDFNNASAYSLQVWVKLAPGDQGGYVPVSRHHATVAQGYFIAIGNMNDGCNSTAGAVHLYSEYPCSPSSAILVNDGNWHQIVGTFQGGIASIYVDGAFQGASSGTTLNALDAYPFLVGGINSAAGVPSNVFTGLIDDVGVWNVALTPAQVLALYQIYQ
jgi:hypothetical protein